MQILGIDAAVSRADSAGWHGKISYTYTVPDTSPFYVFLLYMTPAYGTDVTVGFSFRLSCNSHCLWALWLDAVLNLLRVSTVVVADVKYRDCSAFCVLHFCRMLRKVLVSRVGVQGSWHRCLCVRETFAKLWQAFAVSRCACSWRKLRFGILALQKY